MPHNGPYVSTRIISMVSSGRRVQNDHLEKTIWKDHSGGTVLCLIIGNRKADPSIINSINRWMNWDSQFHMDATPTDINNHADTHWFGQNFWPVCWNENICSVSPLLSEYDDTNNAELCSAVTACIDDRGEVYLLLFGLGYGLVTIWSRPWLALTNVEPL